MKKLLSLIFTALIIFGVASCGGGNKSKTSGDTNAVETMDATTNAMDDSMTNAEATEAEKMEAKAADTKTEAAVENLVEKDSGAEMGLE